MRFAFETMKLIKISIIYDTNATNCRLLVVKESSRPHMFARYSFLAETDVFYLSSFSNSVPIHIFEYNQLDG